ncbi:odorant receptor 49b-like [Copidosoma floridanum]|uniref:odorant receptor 49b-like n=1 Tax=Copidosoma floridanum TaxID=29053 RepID=UPI000C6F9FF2|nr:odorant receptor 49b-like [Copidosoma floridanum]
MAKGGGKKVWTFEGLSGTHVNLLRLIGVLPFEGRTLEFIGSRILGLYCFVISAIYNTMYLFPFARMLTNGDKDFDIGLLCEIVIIQSICIKYVIVFAKREEFARLLGMCKKLWHHVRPEEESGTVKMFEAKAYIIRAFLMYSSSIACVTYIVTGYCVRLPPLEPNGTARRILPFQFYVDVQDEPMYSAVACLQSIVCFTIALIIPGYESTGLFLIMMACGYLRCISDRLYAMALDTHASLNTELSDDDREHGVWKKGVARGKALSRKDVVECAVFHQETLIFCEGIERFTRSIYMTTLLGVLYNLSLIAIKLLQSDSDRFSLLSVFMLHSTSLYICQWSPQHLINESKGVSNAAYFATMEHVVFDKETNKILAIMMLRAQRPVELTAGGYVRLSMQTFGSMLSNAFSFFTVLRNFSG